MSFCFCSYMFESCGVLPIGKTAGVLWTFEYMFESCGVLSIGKTAGVLCTFEYGVLSIGKTAGVLCTFLSHDVSCFERCSVVSIGKLKVFYPLEELQVSVLHVFQHAFSAILIDIVHCAICLTLYIVHFMMTTHEHRSLCWCHVLRKIFCNWRHGLRRIFSIWCHVSRNISSIWRHGLLLCAQEEQFLHLAPWTQDNFSVFAAMSSRRFSVIGTVDVRNDLVNWSNPVSLWK